tara:strand:- start:385 stop:1242 length:858 start_codon:yes stop_codon:yes gene_type:complete
MKIEVLHPGFSTTIQDSGRINGLAYGVPKGGAMDVQLMNFANRLVGNPMTNPVLEFTMQGGLYIFGGDSIIAVTGRGDAFINSNKIELNSRIVVNKGDTLRVNSGRKGRYNYLSVQGRIEAEEFWGSFSTYELAEKGGYNGRRLKKGDVLSIKKGLRNESVLLAGVSMLNKSVIRILKAPEFDNFPEKDIDQIVKGSFKISHHSNRMGYRLTECLLEGTSSGNIVSSGCIPGTIQVPSSGAPIVLMADSPTTGGYPRIGVIHPEDLGDFAQKSPGEMVKFKWFEL